ncbi:hypothetical protein D8674_038017 [Pyrus ussuriensis x Pyrus communis]|uniref:Uncharacterized protein n=1 Tax=Pyrus ussuriensis x Pyrus communis TaxID=2448454 RepID=A0A5N5I4R2_9ROSA|nr:hypothetical protein D8674_038017 [Pyrus ussuriensis x Pyrus communis]
MISQFRNFMTQCDDLLLETPPQYTSLASTIAMGDPEAVPLRNASSEQRAWGEYGNGRADNPPLVVVSCKISDCALGSPILLQSFQ